MPIYEYECRQCRRRFEYLLLRSSPAAECPGCHSQDLEQLLSSPAVSSDARRQANLDAAHKKASGARKERQHEDHKHHHQHFDT